MARKDFSNISSLTDLARGLPSQHTEPRAAPIAVPAATPPAMPANDKLEPEPAVAQAAALALVEAVSAESAPQKPRPKQNRDELVQFSFQLRKSLRKQLKRLAEDDDKTMQVFVLLALKEKGLNVKPEDLVDLRKSRN
jgi:hypothetical protein